MHGILPSLPPSSFALTLTQELEYLVDVNAITPQQLSEIVAKLPPPSNGKAPLSNDAPKAQNTPTPTRPINTEKQPWTLPSSVLPQLPPPAYAHAPIPVTRATATAIYEYSSTDSGDLTIMPKDRISITEFINADWVKGRNERTHAEGIFPRSYVEIVDVKSTHATPQLPQPSNYGNMPLDVSQGSSNPTGGKDSKLGQNANKFGKKLGNASKFIQKP